MIRAEASSIFFKEYFCCDSFVASMYDLEVAMELRIKAVCALVAIHDIHLPISVNVQEMISVHEKLVRQLPLTWLDDERRDLVKRLVRFIADGTSEVFVCRIGPQEQLEGPEDSPYEHMVYVGRKVHVSPNYRIERVDPDAAVSPEQKLVQERLQGRLLQVLGTIGNQQLQGALHGEDPRNEPLRHELGRLESGEFLRVEGPLAELDWDTFQ
jgi:hypothetical protein